MTPSATVSNPAPPPRTARRDATSLFTEPVPGTSPRARRPQFRPSGQVDQERGGELRVGAVHGEPGHEVRVDERTGQRRNAANLDEIEAERAGQRRQMLKRHGLGLQRGHEEGAARGAAVAMRQRATLRRSLPMMRCCWPAKTLGRRARAPRARPRQHRDAEQPTLQGARTPWRDSRSVACSRIPSLGLTATSRASQEPGDLVSSVHTSFRRSVGRRHGWSPAPRVARSGVARPTAQRTACARRLRAPRTSPRSTHGPHHAGNRSSDRPPHDERIVGLLVIVPVKSPCSLTTLNW